jgi:hypothetical protein
VFTINNRPVWRRGLEKAQATLISRYMVKEYVQSGSSSSGSHLIQVWDYLVELADADGKPTRLTIRVKGGGFQLPKDGRPVSVVVNRKRTKAHFDADDPSISLGARYDQDLKKRKAQAQKDKADFEAKRDGRA